MSTLIATNHKHPERVRHHSARSWRYVVSTVRPQVASCAPSPARAEPPQHPVCHGVNSTAGGMRAGRKTVPVVARAASQAPPTGPAIPCMRSSQSSANGTPATTTCRIGTSRPRAVLTAEHDHHPEPAGRAPDRHPAFQCHQPSHDPLDHASPPGRGRELSSGAGRRRGRRPGNRGAAPGCHRTRTCDAGGRDRPDTLPGRSARRRARRVVAVATPAA
jgi:hypothetical protein